MPLQTVLPFNRKTRIEADAGHQRIHLLPFTVDRTNLFVGRVECHVFENFDFPDPSYLNLTMGDSIGAEAGIQNLANNAGGNFPLCVGAERRYDEGNSMAIYTYTYEGIATNHNKRFVDFELEFTMEQYPIETHPQFQRLNDVYGPYDSLNRLWPPIVTEASAAVGLKSTSTGGPVTNPMYGTTSYLVPGCTFRQTYTDVDVDANLLDNIGLIDWPKLLATAGPTFSKFSDLLKAKDKGRNWLKMAPKIRQRGACVSITQEWMLSGPRGWDKLIYGPDAQQLL
jgi:hypothetical protein